MILLDHNFLVHKLFIPVSECFLEAWLPKNPHHFFADQQLLLAPPGLLLGSLESPVSLSLCFGLKKVLQKDTRAGASELLIEW